MCIKLSGNVQIIIIYIYACVAVLRVVAIVVVNWKGSSSAWIQANLHGMYVTRHTD